MERALYYVAINIVAFVAFGVDKMRAREHKFRLSESVLLFLAIAGGSAGALLGMYLWRHKTRRKKFTVGVPVILLVQLALIVFVMYDL